MRILIISFFVLFSSVILGQTVPSTQSSDEIPQEQEEMESVQKAEKKAARPVKNIEKLDKTIELKESDLNDDLYDNRQLQQSAPGVEQQTVQDGFYQTKYKASNQRNQRSPSYSQQVEMDNAVMYLEKNAPNSFEYHYFEYISGNYDVSRYDDLQRAESIRPDNTDVHVQMAGYHIINGNEVAAIEYINKLITSKRLVASVLDYSEDILRSVPQNGVLITHGFDDSYGTWYMQAVKGVRKDVQLVSLDFMQSEYYRSELKKNGLALPIGDKIDVNYLRLLCELNTTKETSISLTTPKEYFKPILNHVYVTGLVFVYKQESFENFARNENLWNNELKKHLISGAKDEKSKQLSSNYLPMLLQMRKVYNQQLRTDKLKEVDTAIDAIGAQCKKYDQVQKLKKAY